MTTDRSTTSVELEPGRTYFVEYRGDLVEALYARARVCIGTVFLDWTHVETSQEFSTTLDLNYKIENAYNNS